MLSQSEAASPMTSGSVLFAGLVAGFAMGLVSVAAGALLMLSISARRPQLVMSLPAGASPALVAICLVHLLLAVWTLVLGPFLALTYARVFAIRWPGPGLGSPNLAFTMAMLLLALLIGLAVLGLARDAVKAAGGLGVVFAAIFGWLLPLLVR